MHNTACTCAACRQADANPFEVLRFGIAPARARPCACAGRAGPGSSPFGQAQEMALAMELMSLSSEAELEQFLGNMFKGVWGGLKKVGSAVGKVAAPLGGVLKGLAKTALPFVGGALGSFIPIPGVGTALGTALGSAVGNALEREFSGMELDQREFEAARRFVRLAGTAAQLAAQDGMPADPNAAARTAVLIALRQHVPQLTARMPQPTVGRWRRRRGVIELDGL